MHSTLANLVDRLDKSRTSEVRVIPWSSPVPAFGSPVRSQVATLGLNPSNREFVDESGTELDGHDRRFHTLHSLGLGGWSDADADDLRSIALACFDYFRGRPYDQWFRRLDAIVAGTRSSYYSDENPACHLDLIPFATKEKWGDLKSQTRRKLVELAADSLGTLLRDSSIRILILNGESVASLFQDIAGIRLERREKIRWRLPRRRGSGVPGYAYSGVIREFRGIPLDRDMLVLGYNHNIQSSFGVTAQVVKAIRHWVASRTKRGQWGAATRP